MFPMKTFYCHRSFVAKRIYSILMFIWVKSFGGSIIEG